MIGRVCLDAFQPTRRARLGDACGISRSVVIITKAVGSLEDSLIYYRSAVPYKVTISPIGTRMTPPARGEWVYANTSAAQCQPPLCKGRCPEGAEGL